MSTFTAIMDYDRYTLKAQEAIQAASAEARKRDHSQVDLEHLVLALLEQEEGVVPALAERIGVDRAALEAKIEALLAKKPKVFGEGSQLYLSPYASTALAKAEA
jgi:ATP-dependent Clp protease ATP-binding subunit ClpB